MYARTMIGQIKPVKQDELAEAIQMYKDSIVSAAQQQKGYKGALLLTNPYTGKALSITLWETEEDMMESETDAYCQEQIAKVGSMLAGPGMMDHYQLSVQADWESL